MNYDVIEKYVMYNGKLETYAIVKFMQNHE